MPKNNTTKYIIILVVLAVIFTLPLWLTNVYIIHMLIRIIMSAVLAIGLTFIYRMGNLSLGHAAYVGIGAYTSVLLVTRLGMSFWAAFFIAGVVTALLALFIGRITLGLRGIYFTITTFALTEVLKGIYIAYPKPFGGPGGIMDIPYPNGIGTHAQFYYFAAAFFVIIFFMFFRLSRSSFGLLCDGLRLSDLLEEHVGLNTRRMKIVVFVISCTTAGLVGSMMAHYLGQITPDVFGAFLSIDTIVYCTIGGLGSVPGAVIGAAILTFVGELLYGIGAYKSLVFGIILVAIILFIPGGVISLPWQKITQLRFKRKEVAGIGSA